MSDSFARREQNTTDAETREQALTRRFYEWERRGRGWDVFPYPVELEPPFRPVYLAAESSAQPLDDGRRPTFLSSLVESFTTTNGGAAKRLPAPESSALAHDDAASDEPAMSASYGESYTELQIVLPGEREAERAAKITRAVSEQLLLSLSYAAHPFAFEVVGTSERIVIQFAATAERDAVQLTQQLQAFLPTGAEIRERSGFLVDAWCKSADRSGAYGREESVVADFGLSREFMLPLGAVSNFESADPLVALLAALSSLGAGEVGVFQVLFQKAKADWTGEIMDSVRFFDGTPFFANAPEMIPLAREKTSRPLFAAVVRAAAKGASKERVWQTVRNLGGALALLASPAGNELIPLSNDGYDSFYREQSLLDRMSHRCGMILNAGELASLVHPPTGAVLRAPKLLRAEIGEGKTKLAPPLALGGSLALGENEHQGEKMRVTLSDEQRAKHIYVVGASGSGKSTLLLNLIAQDFESGGGLCVIDPHGDLIDRCLERVPEHRADDVMLFDPSDAGFPVGFNILEAKSELEKTLLSSDLVAAFRRLSTSWGDVMDSVLANAILAFLESRTGGTLFELKRFLVEKEFREEFLTTVEDEAVCYFWEQEFPLIAGKPQASILIRLDAFLRQRLVRNIVCQKKTAIDFRAAMDTRKILLVKLAHGAIGEENSYLLGTLIVSKLYQAALSRQDTAHRPFFSLYIDEFHHFITPSMENVLSGSRKYNLGLVLAHQEYRQLQSRNQEVASSVLSNCYTRVCFRLAETDAERFSGGFSFFDAAALQNLGTGEAVGRIERADYDFNLKVPSAPPVAPEIAERRKEQIVGLSRDKYAKARAAVEADIAATRPPARAVVEEVETSQAKQALIPPALKDAPLQSETVICAAEQKAAVSAAPADSPAVQPGETAPEAAVRSSPSSVNTPQPNTPPDSDTQSHRYLQSLVKRMAESRGFLASVEKEIFGGAGRIDVALESGNRKIACEISVTNAAEYEIKNIQKCLAAGFDPVVMISADRRHLEKIARRAADDLAASDLEKTLFLAPEEFHSWLENFDAGNSAPEETLKGYKVNVKLKSVDEAARS